MRLVHFADTHLGFKQYQRMTSTGINQREADVARTFSALIDQVIALAPDLVVVGGDIFHVPRPSNPAIIHAFKEFSRLTQSLPNTPVVLVAGNHDTPRSTDTGGILRLFQPLGIHVVDREAQRIAFPALNLSVLAVPDVPGLIRPKFDPDPAARFNVMVLHGEVQGMPNHGHASATEISDDEIQSPSWDYIALGHYHVYQELAPNMYYSGSTDYTSSNPWGELMQEADAGFQGKGFAERDLVTGKQTFHPLPISRAIIDLSPIDAMVMTPADLDAALRSTLEACEMDGKIVRLVVNNTVADTVRALDHRALRSYRARTLNLNIEFRRPERVTMESGRVRLSRMSLDEMLTDYLTNKRELPSDINRAEFIELATAYMDKARDPAQDDFALIESPEAAA